MSHSYPSDISREQLAMILPMLESARRLTKVDLYDVFYGVLYLLKSGCLLSLPEGAAAPCRLPRLAYLLQVFLAME